MEEIRIAVLGDADGIRNVKNAIKYPQFIGAVWLYDNDFVSEIESDFLDGWDIIIVSFESPGFSEKMISILKCYFNGGRPVILDFYGMRYAKLPTMNVDIVMRNPYYDHYDGIILGISHSEKGIIAERLSPGNFANLSVPSQDIYFNYRTLEYCYEHYREKIAGASTAIIEMYDYSYFNYDVSRTSKITNYIGCGGFVKDKHNFDKNIDYPGLGYENLVATIGNIFTENYSSNELELWDMLFYNDPGRLFSTKYITRNEQKYRLDIVSEEQVGNFKIGRYIREKFEDTISENKEYLGKTLELLNTINPEIKVFFLLMPRYEGVWEKEAEMIHNWKEFFYDSLDEVGEKFRCELLDFSRNDIAKNRAYYQDETHFNFLGAMKFTDMLNQYLTN